jgi:hypothetical protein
MCTTGFNDTGGKFAAGINNTGGKFTTSVNDTVCKFANGVNDTGSKLPPVSTTPVANNGTNYQTVDNLK